MTAVARLARLSLANVRSPASASYSATQKLYWSLLGPTGSLANCSGDMYAGVPEAQRRATKHVADRLARRPGLLTPQELVLLYIILEIGVCHGEPPPPPPPVE